MKTGTGLGYFAMVALIAGTVGFSATSADAGKGNGNGNGSGNGNDNNSGHANGKDNNPGQANGRAHSASTHNGNGNLASAMGSLNAAHASPSGLAHASSKSKVGRLASYMHAMVVYEDEFALVDWDAYDEFIDDIADIDDQIAGLQADIDALDPEDPNFEIDKAALEGQIADLEEDKADLQADADTLTAAVDAALGDAASDLENAANKDGLIDATVVDAVNSLLDGKSEDFTHSTIIHDSEEGIADIINPAE